MPFIKKDKTISALMLKPGDTVVDFGVGRGDSLETVEEMITNSGSLYLYDINEDIINTVKNQSKKRGFTNLYTSICNLEKVQEVKLPEKKVDVVILSNILFLLENKLELLSISSGILKNSGRIMVIDWKSRIAGSIPNKQVSLVDEESLKSVMEKLGCEFLHQVPAGDYHFGHIYSKVK